MGLSMISSDTSLRLALRTGSRQSAGFRVARLVLSLALLVLGAGRTAEGEGSADSVTDRGWTGSLHGYVLVGERRYAVDGTVHFDGDRMTRLGLSVALGTGPAHLEVAYQRDGGTSIAFAGRRYSVSGDMLLGWGEALLRDQAGIESGGQYTHREEDGGIAWERKDFLWLAPCFPARVRYLYSVGQGGLSRSGPCQIAVHSLAEWNNPFHETVLLHLFLKGPEQGAER